MFYRKHFRILAQWVRSRSDLSTDACLSLAKVLKGHSACFNTVRFLQACGYDRAEAAKLAEQVDKEYAP